MKHLKEAFKRALSLENINLKAFATQRDINPARISEFLHRNGRLAGKLKASIFKDWSNDATQVMLFDAHIKDEIEACRVIGEINAVAYNDRPEADES